MVDGGIKGRLVAHWPQLLNKVFLLVGVVDVRALDHKARANQVLTVIAEVHVLTVAAQPAAQIRLPKRKKIRFQMSFSAKICFCFDFEKSAGKFN